MVLALMGAGFGMEIGKLGIIRNTVIKYSKLVNTHPALPPNRADESLLRRYFKRWMIEVKVWGKPTPNFFVWAIQALRQCIPNTAASAMAAQVPSVHQLQQMLFYCVSICARQFDG